MTVYRGSATGSWIDAALTIMRRALRRGVLVLLLSLIPSALAVGLLILLAACPVWGDGAALWSLAGRGRCITDNGQLCEPRRELEVGDAGATPEGHSRVPRRIACRRDRRR